MFHSYLIWYLYLGALAGLIFLARLLSDFSPSGKSPITEKEKAAAAAVIEALQEAFDAGAWLRALLCLLCALWVLWGAITVAVLWPVWVVRHTGLGRKN